MTPRANKSKPAESLRADMRDAILIRLCHGIPEFEACVAVERGVWQSADLDIVPIPLFVVAAETGGQVIGAFLGRELVGFTLAIAGWRNRMPFLHSHMTAVLSQHSGRGIGRRLKQFQREDALSRGISLIEWTFDPLITRNAYFNFMRLGAIARRYMPNVYGITTSPLHAGLPTDRLVAEWHLRSGRVRRVLAATPARNTISPKAERIIIPAELDALKQSNPAAAAYIQSRIRAEFQRCLAKGYAATAVTPGAAGVEYILEPWKAK